MKNGTILFLILLSFSTIAQKLHSHNDYEQAKPFYNAYDLGFDSIEADLVLKDGELFVAHESENINSENTFTRLYLKPILQKVKENDGFAYKNKQKLQLLIDLKTDGKEILKVLYQQLKPHKEALKNIKIVISGDMPEPSEFKNYNKIFFFDGRISLNYTAKQWQRVGLMSVSFREFDKSWDGTEALDKEIFDKVRAFIEANKIKNKEVRFWATPNTTLAFETLRKLGVGYIGTDNLALLKGFKDKF
jgi:hypothetical protein